MKSILRYALVTCFTVSAIVSAQTTHVVNVNFSGMQEYAGMKMEIKMINTSTKAIEGDTVIPALSGNNFSLAFTGTHAVSSNVDFYIDKNRNGTYDPPPIDAAWRLSTGPLHSTATLSFVNNTNYTDIGAGVNSVARVNPIGNPANDFKVVNNGLEIPANYNGKTLQLQAFDLSGRLLWVEKLSAKGSRIEFNHSRHGIVFLKIRENNSVLKSIGIR